jgi:hypothetical protein
MGILLLLVFGCTGVVPEALDLSSLVEPNGWIVLDDGSDSPVLLRRREVEDGVPSFVDAEGKVVRAFEVRAEGPLSVFILPAHALLVLERWGDARVPDVTELSVEPAGTALAECACPVPPYGERVRFLPGATCALPSESGRSVAWDGEAWVWSEGARSELRLHHGGSACVPSLDEVLARDEGARNPPQLLLRLEPDEYEHLEAMGDGRVFVAGRRRSGVVDVAEGRAVLRGHPDVSWEVRAVLAPWRGDVVGVIRWDFQQIGEVVWPLWLVRGGVALVDPGAYPVLEDAEGRARFSEWAKANRRPELALGALGELLVETGTATPGVIRVQLGPPATLAFSEAFSALAPTVGATWLHSASGQEMSLYAREPPGSEDRAPSLSVSAPLLGRPAARVSAFPRVDLALVLEEDGSIGPWSFQMWGLVRGAWRELRRHVLDPAGPCGPRFPERFFAAFVEGRLRMVLGTGLELGLDGSCLPLELGSDVVSAAAQTDGMNGLFLTAKGALWGLGVIEAPSRME